MGHEDNSASQKQASIATALWQVSVLTKSPLAEWERSLQIIQPLTQKLESAPNEKQISHGKWYQQLFWKATVYLYNIECLLHCKGVGTGRMAQEVIAPMPLQMWHFQLVGRTQTTLH